ncbi:FixH family protein [Aestuariivirga sp.]|uniref:FixH family protein n=1 Tax=Aestuariivirga sp. TaxID=2650926 RepID=UPI003919B7B1
MTTAATEKQLTGWHVLAMLLAFFGVIIGVNGLMAYFANSTWSGLIVANGYVASQSFDKDLARAKAQDALGWNVGFTFGEDRIRLTFEDAGGAKIDGLSIAGNLERTVTDKEDQKLTFAAMGAGVYSAPARLSSGVWEVEVHAQGEGVPDYRKIFRFFVKGAQP